RFKVQDVGPLSCPWTVGNHLRRLLATKGKRGVQPHHNSGSPTYSSQAHGAKSAQLRQKGQLDTVDLSRLRTTSNRFPLGYRRFHPRGTLQHRTSGGAWREPRRGPTYYREADAPPIPRAPAAGQRGGSPRSIPHHRKGGR